MKKTVSALFAALTLMGFCLLPGCSDSGSGGNTSATVQGQAYFNGPIEGATVSILDSNREILASEDGATDSDGNFSILVFDLPQSFFIEVEGGAVNKVEYAETENSLGQEPEIASVTQEAFGEKVDRYVGSFDSNVRYAVNILSSILVDFLAFEPDEQKAEKYLQDYLQLPGYISVEEAIQSANWYGAYFNPDYFLEDMTEEWGYTDYDQFMEFVVQNIQWFAEDWDAAEESAKWKMVIRSLPKSISQSQLTVNATYDGEQIVGVAPMAILEGADMIFNVIGFALSAIYKNLPDTEGKRILGTFLSYLFEGGPDPVVTALFENLQAIHESLGKIGSDIHGLHQKVDKEFSEIKTFIQELPLVRPISEIDGLWEDYKILKVYKHPKGTPLSEGAIEAIDKFYDKVYNKVSGNLAQIRNTVTGKSLSPPTPIFETWVEAARDLTYTDVGKYRTPIYQLISFNFQRLMFSQALARTFQIECAMWLYAKDKVKYEKEKDKAKLYAKYLQDDMKEQVELFEQWMEVLALDFEWQIYSKAGADPNAACPDFPLGNGKDGILSGVDKFVQKFVHGKTEKYTEAGEEKERLVAQDMLTVRVLASNNAGGKDNETMGLVGVKSSRYWDAYKDMKGMPNVSADPPGKETADNQFDFYYVKISPYLLSDRTDDLVKLEGYPRVITGRSPFEHHDVVKCPAEGCREEWQYRLHKYRRVFNLSSGPPDPNRTFAVELQTRLKEQGCWHPNLMKSEWPDANGNWGKKLDDIRLPNGKATYCESYGLYGLKGPQYVRLMAYHASNKPGDDWWYSGWRSQDRGWLFANRQDAYTFYQLWPLGWGTGYEDKQYKRRAWYALRDSRGTSWKDGANEWPVYYTEREHRSEPVNKWICVDPKKDWFGHRNLIFANKDYITPQSTYKVEYKKTVKKRYYDEYNKYGYCTFSRHQPSTKLYTMKTTYPDYENGKYLKWHWESGQWDRYHADGTDNDAKNNKDCWISIMPEYDAMVHYLLITTK